VVTGVRCEHEHEDGAYVLGALSPAERAAYERHLATCSFCREAVADIAALPDLLSRLDAHEFAKLVDPSLTPSLPSSPRVASLPRRETAAHKIRVRVLSSAAVVVLVVLVGLGVVAWTRDGAPSAPPPGPAVAMTALDPGSPLSATIRVTGSAGGTQVELVCSYSKSASMPYTFTAIAYGPDEQKEQIGSWQASPGAEFPMQGNTHFGRGSLSRVELVQFDGKALLAYDVR
jgi:Putative zinc-finger